MTDQNLQVNGQAGDEYAQEEDRPMGLTEKLKIMAEEMLAISKEAEPDEKNKYFDQLMDDLNNDLERVQEAMNSLRDPEQEKGMTDRVKEVLSDVDDKFMKAFETFSEVIEAMMEFLETENQEILDNAMVNLAQCPSLLEQADVAAQQLNAYLEMPETSGEG